MGRNSKKAKKSDGSDVDDSMDDGDNKKFEEMLAKNDAMMARMESGFTALFKGQEEMKSGFKAEVAGISQKLGEKVDHHTELIKKIQADMGKMSLRLLQVEGQTPKLGPKHLGVATLCRSQGATLGHCLALPKSGVPLRWLTARPRLKAVQDGSHLLLLAQVLVQFGQVLGIP